LSTKIKANEIQWRSSSHWNESQRHESNRNITWAAGVLQSLLTYNIYVIRLKRLLENT